MIGAVMDRLIFAVLVLAALAVWALDAYQIGNLL